MQPSTNWLVLICELVELQDDFHGLFVKIVAQTADLVHGWKDAAPQVKIRLDVLNASPEPVIDVTSEAQVLDDWEDASDPLDEY